jgi:hypothetical protein
VINDLLADLALVLVACGFVLLIPMSDSARLTTGVVLAIASTAPMAVALIRVVRGRR